MVAFHIAARSAYVTAGSAAFQITFGTSPWLKYGKPYQPVVLSSSLLSIVSTVTANGFTVQSRGGAGKAAKLAVGFAVCAG